MWSKKCLSLALLALVLGNLAGCLPRTQPATLAGVSLQPGRYLKEYYYAPGFAPDQITYRLRPFTVERTKNVAPETFQFILQSELARAWEANGLKITPQGEAAVSGTVQLVKVNRGLRFLIGRISEDLSISGVITRGENILFAFQDRIHVTSPTNPGPPAPKETELLTEQAVRTFSSHLLDELLLQGATAGGG